MTSIITVDSTVEGSDADFYSPGPSSPTYMLLGTVSGDNAELEDEDGYDDTITATGANDLIRTDGDGEIAGGNLLILSGDNDYGLEASGHSVINATTMSGGLTDLGVLFADTVFGSAGADDIQSFIAVGKGAVNDALGNLIYGGEGSDTIFASYGADTIYGGQGDDHISLGSREVTPEGKTLAPLFISGDLGNDVIDLSTPAGGYAAFGHDTVYGGGGDDTIRGGAAGGDLLYGQAGNDTIDLNVAGTIYGGQGNDVLSGDEHYTAYISGDLGDDTISAGGTADTLFGGDGNDSIQDAGTGEQIYGNAGNDHITILPSGFGTSTATVHGGQGDDYIDGTYSTSGTQLFGELGNDTILGGTSGGDSIAGGQGVDTIKLGNHSAADYVLFAQGDSPTSAPATPLTIDTITGFSSSDHLVYTSASGLTEVSGSAAPGTVATPESAEYAAAYNWAYGDGGASPAHVAAGEYGVYHVNGDTFVFTSTSDAVFLEGYTESVTTI